MHARVGDRMVVASARLNGPVRDGEILSVGDGAGGGPYRIRWSDDGHESLFFPGPDAHVETSRPAPGPGHSEGAAAAADAAGSPAAGHPARRDPQHTKKWQVDIYVYESAEDTVAQAVLRSGETTPVNGRGKARLRPGDVPVPEIGDELAVARALRHLADRLQVVASVDLAGVAGTNRQGVSQHETSQHGTSQHEPSQHGTSERSTV